MIYRYLLLFLAACAGGYFFSLLHLPLPWTLGPMVTVVIIKNGFGRAVAWPPAIRNIAMVVLGYVMGGSFTPETGQHVLLQLPVITVMTMLTVGLCLLGGYISHRFTDADLVTSLMGSMPGGLSQMAMICEDIKTADAGTVIMMQTIRMITVVFVVPFLVLHGLANQVSNSVKAATAFDAGDLPALLLFAGVIFIVLYVYKKMKLPSAALLAPILGTAGLTLSGVHAPPLPAAVIAIAQICVGIRMGMPIRMDTLMNNKRVLFYSFLSILMVIALLLVFDYLLAGLTGIDVVSAVISTAPGGITEMGLTAMMVHADLSTVIAFQLFRLMFVLIIAIPALRWWVGRSRNLLSN